MLVSALTRKPRLEFGYNEHHSMLNYTLQLATCESHSLLRRPCRNALVQVLYHLSFNPPAVRL